VPEAIARVARVIAAGASKYAALISRFGMSGYDGDAEQQIGTMIGQLLQGAARMTAERRAGVEKAAALVTTVFLQGTQSRQGQL
jgi:hypothetical protein